MKQDIRIRERVLWQPKAGLRAEEYEDAAAVSDSAVPPLRAAVADGATESAFAGLWANHLVRGFVAEGATEAEAFKNRLYDWQWACIRAIEDRAQDHAWYTEAKAEEGAHATFLGLHLHADQSWQALVVGDCCLFHLRDEAIQRQWPMAAPEAFGNRPALLSSRPEQSTPTPEIEEGQWAVGDAFLLATDALAAWMMQTAPADLLDLHPDTFQETITAAREDDALRNDDVTVLILEIEGRSGEDE